MNRKSVAVLILIILGGSLFFVYDYHSTHYDIPQDYPVVIGTGRSYFIDDISGSDANSGVSPEQAWKTVSKVNSFQFSAGDKILFKSNGTWRERIIPQNGKPDGWLYYGSYGQGRKPLFIGSISLQNGSKWVDQGNDVWMWDEALVDDAGNLIFNNETVVGVKKWAIGDLSKQGDFFFEKNTGKLYLKSAANPANVYSIIECAIGQHMMYKPHDKYPHIGVHNAENIVIENLAFRYGGAYAFKFQNINHIHILNCEIAWMGGAEVDGQPKTRYGNGIEFFGKAFHCKAIGNVIDQMYDSGVSYQAINRIAAGIGLSFLNNSISNCAYAGLELWLHDSRCEITNFTFTNNSVKQIGFGWGANATQRKPNANWGFGFLFDQTSSPVLGLIIKNNIVGNCSSSIIACHEIFNGIEKAEIDFNTYFGNVDDRLYIRFTSDSSGAKSIAQYTLSQYAEYQQYTKKDAHSEFNF